MEKEKLIEDINSGLNSAIGRLTMFRQIPEVKEAHEKLLEAAGKFDDLVNEYLLDD